MIAQTINYNNCMLNTKMRKWHPLRGLHCFC